MIDRSEAEEHLRIIRSLMEKATIYRTISAEAALVAGSLSVVTASVGASIAPPSWDLAVELVEFATPWVLVLLTASAANFFLLSRDAQRRGEAFISQRMRLAIRGMLPALLAGAVCVLVPTAGGWAGTASLWVLFYGISLLAASHFAPKSICWLGRAFFAAGVALLLAGSFVFDWWLHTNQLRTAHLIMGATFGLFHLVYAACAWPRGAKAEATSPQP